MYFFVSYSNVGLTMVKLNLDLPRMVKSDKIEPCRVRDAPPPGLEIETSVPFF